ncbi:hypothetical protein EJB05_28674 [Eragrostis curvula]|uniref:Uncharacterized protein n=2 Tax=Eragrostis curvula TaxID=38414 RepID=A0A5J9US43_9POAL|nr:hypothetical protein EJB05_28674 [Eragrostis curvula]
MSAVLWRLSPLICSYLFSWTVALSEARGAISKFMRVSYMLLLAVAAAKLVGDRAGAAVMFLTTVYSAILSGRALAERRQLAGTERSADDAALSATSYQSRAEDDHDWNCRTVLKCCHVFMVVVLTLVMSSTVLSAPGPEAETDGEVVLSLFVSFAAPSLLAARMILLYGGAFHSGSMWEEPFGAMVLRFIGWIVSAVLVGFLFGPSSGVAFFWLAPMRTAGLLGYRQGVSARYKQLVAIKRSQPRTAEDASGLLAGRDKEDVCYVHI